MRRNSGTVRSTRKILRYGLRSPINAVTEIKSCPTFDQSKFLMLNTQ
jgi:hypothetical protein